jgi:hypothetical protein
MTVRVLILLLGLTLLSSSGLVFAQLSVGVQGGLNSGNFTGDTPEDASYRGTSSFTGGAILEYSFAPDVAISVQPSLLMNGTTVAFDVPGTEDETRDSVSISLDYVSVPVIARVVTDGGRWYVTGGPIFGFLSSAAGTFEGTGQDVDLTDSFESYDLSLVFGVGHFFPIGRVKSFAEIRFVQGMLNISDVQLNPNRVRNSGRQVLLGVLYTFGS